MSPGHWTAGSSYDAPPMRPDYTHHRAFGLRLKIRRQRLSVARGFGPRLRRRLSTSQTQRLETFTENKASVLHYNIFHFPLRLLDTIHCEPKEVPLARQPTYLRCPHPHQRPRPESCSSAADAAVVHCMAISPCAPPSAPKVPRSRTERHLAPVASRSCPHEARDLGSRSAHRLINQTEALMPSAESGPSGSVRWGSSFYTLDQGLGTR